MSQFTKEANIIKKLCSKGLSQATIDTIKEFSPMIYAKSFEITPLVYERFFQRYPRFVKMFEYAPKNQTERLSDALATFAVNIDNLTILKPALHAIAIKHATVGVKREHYIMLGLIFVEVVEEVFGETVMLEYIDAIREGYMYISDILIEMESEIYREIGESSHITL